MRQWRLLAHKEGTPHPNASRGEEQRNEEDCCAEIGVRYVGLCVVVYLVLWEPRYPICILSSSASSAFMELWVISKSLLRRSRSAIS